MAWPVMALKQFSQVVQVIPIQVCTAPMIMMLVCGVTTQITQVSVMLYCMQHALYCSDTSALVMTDIV